MSSLLPNPLDFSDPERLELSRVLRNPTFTAAVNIVLRNMIPPASAGFLQTAEQQAAGANQLSGATRFLTAMADLATPTPDTPDDFSGAGEFEHLAPEEPQ